MRFDRVAILGGGLLGGSLALRARDFAEVALWVRREASRAEADAMGIPGATTDLAEALDGADLVMLGVPVGVMPALVEQACGAGLSPDALVSDVGSVKRCVHASLPAEVRFIGGHPMAGSENRGLSAARRDLFQDAACLLTDDGGVGDPWASALEAFWREAGCRVRWMSAEAHDHMVARISHFPHVMAAVAAVVGLKHPEEGRFGGGGIRDTTRVAGGDPDMWAEILMENREAVGGAVEEGRRSLSEMLAILERGDHLALRDWLAAAQRAHAAGRDARNHDGNQGDG